MKRFVLTLMVMTITCIYARAQESQSNRPSTSPARAVFLRAFVIDDRLSALRRDPSLHSEVTRRLHLGRSIFIIRGSSRDNFCRVAVTRRTRGWILEAALAVQGRAAEDQRIMRLIETSGDRTNADVLDRLTLCRILIDHFPASRLLPRAMLSIGGEADRAAEALSQRVRKRLGQQGREGTSVAAREYYLSDAGLDRYSRLHISFDFNDSTGEYVYDGRVYRDIVKRFPGSEEAKVASERLEVGKQKMARTQ